MSVLSALTVYLFLKLFDHLWLSFQGYINYLRHEVYTTHG